VAWRPGVRLEISRLKMEVARWRGGVRYGGARLTVSGVLVETASAAASERVLQASETGQRFRLRAAPGQPVLEGPMPGQRLRVVGRVIRGGERSHDEIVLELERAEPAAAPISHR
jgi:hypothetical protein